MKLFIQYYLIIITKSSIIWSINKNWSTVYFIDSAVLAHFLLKETLRKLGILGCVLCIVGSTVIVLHAPGEHSISSVEEIWELAIQPGEHMHFDCCCFIFSLFSSIEMKKEKKNCFWKAFKFSWSSFSFVHGFSSSSSVGTCFVLWTTLWADKHHGLYWGLFYHWILNSKYMSFLLTT